MQTQTNLPQQAENLFPLVDYVPQSSVMHARAQWVKAKEYMQANGLEVKPIINARIEFQPEKVH